MNQKQRYIKTFAGLKIQLLILLTSIATAYGYAWMGHTRINDTFIVVMLRVFIVFTDLGIFLAVGYMVDFKRGIAIGYVYKILAFLQTDQLTTVSEIEFVFRTVGKSFGLVLYYKLILFMIIFLASHLVEIQHDQAIEQKHNDEGEEHKRLIKEQQQQKEKMFSKSQRQQFYEQQKAQKRPNYQKQQTQKTIKRIKLSLRYHKQEQFYKKLQIFFFVFYNSVCILTLFPLQEYVLDFTRVLSLRDKVDFFQHAQNLKTVNEQVIWYINFQTVWNVVMFWLVILVGEFKIKSNYPQLIKQYLLGVPVKFLIIQIISLVMLLIVLATTCVSQQIEILKSITLLSLVNHQTFTAAYLLHTLLPLFISFLLLRLYLGQTFYLNRLVSRKYSFHQNDQDGNSNLDCIFYQGVIQDDINRVRHFIIGEKELLSRHKLKRYTEEEKLKHYVDQQTILEIQSLFEDYLVLDLYNKLSRYLVISIFYITLGIFLISLNINDTYLAMSDQFFTHIPAILLWVGMFFVFKYQSSVNVFYPKFCVWMIKRLSEWLAYKKVYNFIKLFNFYSIIFSIWLYRIWSEVFLPTHQSLQKGIKQLLYNYYSSPSLTSTSIISQLLSGWSQYFINHSSSCDYDMANVVMDSLMVMLMVGYVVVGRKQRGGKQTQHNKSEIGSRQYYQKGDIILLLLKLVTPLYALYIFVVEMQCLEWGRVTFCTCFIIGVMFMHVNDKELKRGIVRNDDGEINQHNFTTMY